jgi:predicted amidophosphoribosyltransferase
LDEGDDCYFYGEYTARRGFNFSETNRLIFNFKKGMEKQSNAYEWRYKAKAIRQAAQMLRETLASQPNLEALRGATLVPIPPSRSKKDPLYDGRVVSMLQQLSVGIGLDIRELVVQKETVEPSHSATSRATPNSLAQNYEIDVSLKDPYPNSLWVFDDVLTTGAHFKAMKKVLNEAYPGIPCIGVFLARRALEADEI